jgi:hypothetical protein
MRIILIPTTLLSLTGFPLLVADLLDLKAIYTRLKEGLSDLRGWVGAPEFEVIGRLWPFLV